MLPRLLGNLHGQMGLFEHLGVSEKHSLLENYQAYVPYAQIQRGKLLTEIATEIKVNIPYLDILVPSIYVASSSI